jgi:hypothetical protein
MPDQPPAGDEAQEAAAERLAAFQRDALVDIDITSADDLDEAFVVLGDATLAHVLATHPPGAEAALPDRVQEPLSKARRGIN